MAGDGVQNPSNDTALLAAIAALANTLVLIQAALVIIDNEVGQVHTVVDAIRVVTDSTPVLTETGGTLTSDGTEQDVYINNAPAGVFRPIKVNVDTTNSTITETVIIREYYRIIAGGGWVIEDEKEYNAAVALPCIPIELNPTRFGVRVTLEKTAGTNRDYDWEVFYEETP